MKIVKMKNNERLAAQLITTACISAIANKTNKKWPILALLLVPFIGAGVCVEKTENDSTSISVDISYDE